jgi:putative transposase
MANRAIKYRVYPTLEQCILFAKTFGCCRKVYNLMLEDKINGYNETGKFPVVTPAKYKKQYPFLKEVDSLALCNKQLDLQRAFKNHFDKNRKSNTEFPKFKSKHHTRKSYTTNNNNNNVAIVGDSIKLPKVGLVKAVLHILPKPEWVLKSATVSQDPDGKYYISVLFEYEDIPVNYTIDESKAIGLDYKSNGLFADSNGDLGSDHRFFRESEKKLAKAQQKLSRKVGAKKGEEKSNNYIKQKKKVAKIQKHIANQRKDYLHKKSTEIANLYDVVCAETLNMKAMANRGFHNGKSTMDNGYGMFLTMLAYKLEERGKILVKVDRYYPSSQTCHNCGKRHPEMKITNSYHKTLRCDCGYTMDRDRNAALNILDEGLRILRENP